MAKHATSSDQFLDDALQGGTDDTHLDVKVDARESTAGKIRLLWNRRQLILRLAGAGLILSSAIAFVIPKRYESTTRLMPPDQATSNIAMLAAAAGGQAGSSGIGAVASDLLGLKTSGGLFIGILQSRTVQNDLIDKFGLQKVYGDRQIMDARIDLSKNTDISEDRKSGIIAIQVTDKVPERAAGLAEEYVEELNRVVTGLNTSSAHRERMFLEARLAQVKQDLESAEKGFGEYASKNTAIDIQAQGKAMIEAAGALEGQLIAAQTERQGLKQIYTDDNVRVRAAEARVEELQRQVQRIDGQSDSTIGTAQQSDNSENSIYPSIRQLPLLGIGYADLYRATKVQETIFETLTREYELAKVQEAKEIPSVKMIDPPDVPGRKSYPPRTEIMLVGTLAAIFVGVVAVFADEIWRNTDPQDPQKVLALDIYRAVRGRLSWASQNPLGVGAAKRRLRRRLHQGQLDKQS